MRRHLTSTLPPADVAGVIVLDQARVKPRTQNEYVRTPHTVTNGTGKNTNIAATNVNPRERAALPNRTSQTIRTQPNSKSPPLKQEILFKVEENDDDSIICSKCGKCRCGMCTSRHELPSKWLCGDKVNISTETVVEYATCMCCVKGIFYHCSMDDQDSDFDSVSQPCAGCSRPHCCKRWTCILATSLCLPCMCLYPPAKCGLMACTACYNRCRKKGCTCNIQSQIVGNNRSRSSGKVDTLSQYRGLLIESDRESSSVSNS